MLGKAIKSGPTVFLLSSRKRKEQDVNALQKHRVKLVGCNNDGRGISSKVNTEVVQWGTTSVYTEVEQK